MLALVGEISSTSVSTLRAGSTVVAPNGDIKAEIETRNMIHVFIRELNTEYGSSGACFCNVSRCMFFSISACDDTRLSILISFSS